MRAHSGDGPAVGRRGVAAAWAIVVLGVLGLILGTLAVQLVANRGVLNRREDRAQSLWLARAGIELAAARLLGDPAGYQGETVKPVPEGQVKITVQADKGAPNVFVVTSEARYPTGNPHPVVEVAARRFRRSVDKGQVRLEAIGPGPVKR